MIATLRKRLFDWIIPDSALSGIGRVRWRIYEHDEEARNFVRTIAAAFEISTQLLERSGSWWYGKRFVWKAWPSMEEAIMMDLVIPVTQLHDTSSLDPESADLSALVLSQSGVDHPVDRS